ncbi:MAG: aromatic ring-hydroxylating dioxygenase subunit alpha [Prochlorococcaceae cyanobacterium]
MIPAAPFLPAWLYSEPDIAEREQQLYARRCWHPIAASSELAEGQALAMELLGLPLLLTRTDAEPPRAFLNRCPHRGMHLLKPGLPSRNCRRLVCPYHGWTYNLNGQLRAAAREAEFVEPFSRSDWPLQQLPCRQEGPLIWVALDPDPLPLEQQLDLLLREAGSLWRQPRQLLAREQRPLACNWKLAHDNTLDDYHVAIAHPQTLHRLQGPVRGYRHLLSRHCSLLATPSDDNGSFLTFGLLPWTHLLLWSDGRLAVLQFVPELHNARRDPQAQGRCNMNVWLLGFEPNPADAGWMAEMMRFLEEDRQLVESVQRGYASGLQPGPAHRLETRILHWQALYAEWMELDRLEPKAPQPNQASMAASTSKRATSY